MSGGQGPRPAAVRDAARGAVVVAERVASSAAAPGWPMPRITLPEGGRMTAFDLWADRAVARHLRGRPGPDRVMYLASAVGDHGIIWLALAGVAAIRRHDEGWRRPLLRAAAGLGLESAFVNGPVKWMFRRTRPIHDAPRPRHLRQPRTSSFPSGHATAAFFAAALLRDDDPWWPVYYGLAVIVAASRVHVGIHHASDVVGGVVIGAALGEAVRHLVPAPASRRPTDESESPAH